MSFSVNIKALVGLPAALNRREYDIDMARRYLATNTQIETFGLADIHGVHERVIAAISAYLGNLNDVYASVDAQRIRDAVAAYRSSDLRAATRADATIIGLPPGLPQRPPITADERAYDSSIFDDRRTPTAMLTPPTSHYADYPYKPSWSDVFSPTTVARDVVWKVTGFLASIGLLDRPIDPLDEFVRPFVGDWAGLLRSAEVFAHLGEMLPQESSCVSDSSLVLGTVWTGNVADMCAVNLGAFASSLTDAFPPLSLLTTKYQQVAKGVLDNANIMETLVTNMIDIAGGLALAETALGGFEVWDASSQVRDFVRTVEVAIEVINNVLDLIGIWRSGADAATSQFGVLQMVNHLPEVRPAPPILLPAR